MTQVAEIQVEDLLCETRGPLGFITLNRPQALNALNLNMIREMDRALIRFAADPSVHAVVVTGAGDRAFCSGGDVKAVAIDARRMQAGDAAAAALPRNFFREEYILNNRIHSFPKPYISLVNGIVMGGGKGISAHGSHRVVTENTLFAMPETSIGFFPDVGGGYFLPRCPGQTGTWLALTSKRIRAIDTVYIGFATDFVPASRLPELVEALQAADWPVGAAKADVATFTSGIIAGFADEAPGDSEIAPHRPQIDMCFGHDRMEDIVTALQDDGSDWAEETLQALFAMSPTSLKVALRQIREGAGGMSFPAVMTMEYRISQALVKSHDFYEGIRAALIDKDREPKWSPARLSEVDDAAVEACFARPADGDLTF